MPRETFSIPLPSVTLTDSTILLEFHTLLIPESYKIPNNTDDISLEYAVPSLLTESGFTDFVLNDKKLWEVEVPPSGDLVISYCGCYYKVR